MRMSEMFKCLTAANGVEGPVLQGKAIRLDVADLECNRVHLVRGVTAAVKEIYSAYIVS